MTLVEAIGRVEAMFIVHYEAGCPVPYENQDGRAIGDGPRDMTLAPNGEPYLTVSSYGIEELLEDAPVFFASEDLAAEWWFDEVKAWQEHSGATHLYWRTQPAFVSGTYLAMDQGHLLRSQNPLAALPQVTLGFVTASMLISRRNPEGKED